MTAATPAERAVGLHRFFADQGEVPPLADEAATQLEGAIAGQERWGRAVREPSAAEPLDLVPGLTSTPSNDQGHLSVKAHMDIGAPLTRVPQLAIRVSSLGWMAVSIREGVWFDSHFLPTCSADNAERHVLDVGAIRCWRGGASPMAFDSRRRHASV